MDDYLHRGYLTGRFADTPTLRAAIDALAEIRAGTLRPGFFFMHKAGRRDVKPRAFEYSDAFLEILRENGIPQMIRRIVGHPVTLAVVSIVDSLPPGYFTNWHADNYMPADHKVIFYPAFGHAPEHRIDVLEGHIKRFGRGGLRERLAVNRYVIQAEAALAPHRVRSIYSSDRDFLLVNTQTLHRTAPVGRDGDIRILYSFRAPFVSLADRRHYLSQAVGTVDDQLALEERFVELL